MSLAIVGSDEAFKPAFSRQQYANDIKKIHGASVIEIGFKLLEAKESLAHGEFTDMVENDLKDCFSLRTAQRYMAEATNSKTTALSPNYSTRAVLRQLPAEQQANVSRETTYREAVSLVRKVHRPDAPSRIGAPSEPENGIVTRYAQFVWLAKRAREAAGVSQLELDAMAGFQDGYTGKLEQPDAQYGRSAVMPTFDAWLSALAELGLRLTVTIDAKATRRLKLEDHRVNHMRSAQP